MTVDVTYIELKNFSKYVCPVDIVGVPCLLTASYNSRKGQRLISLTSYDGEIVYLKPTFITNLDRVFLNFNMLLNELNVYVTLEALTVNGVKQTSTDYLNWSSGYRLAFVSLPPTERLEGFRNLSDEEDFEDSDEEDFEEFEWIVTSSEYLTDGSYQTVRYTGTRVIENKDYISYADIDIVEHIVRSFHDADLQTYAAFTSAVDELTGVSDWVLDPANNQIKYSDVDVIPTTACPSNVNLRFDTYEGPIVTGSPSTIAAAFKATREGRVAGKYGIDSIEVKSVTCANNKATFTYVQTYCQWGCSPSLNYPWTDYIKTYTFSANIIEGEAEDHQKSIPLSTVAQKVISNAESGEDEVLKLLSEDYINLVAESIFNTDTSKQFVKLEDLMPQFELNKVLVK